MSVISLSVRIVHHWRSKKRCFKLDCWKWRLQQKHCSICFSVIFQ